MTPAPHTFLRLPTGHSTPFAEAGSNSTQAEVQL